jgi:1-acyl-sn-glycerol-3-phosphate acyltransferase
MASILSNQPSPQRERQPDARGHSPLKTFRHALLWWSFRTLLRGVGILGHFLYGLEIHGREHLQVRGPLIILARRISRVDFFASGAWAILGESSGLTGAMTICNSRLIARTGRALGILPTVKGKGRSAAPLLQAYNLLREGKIIILPDEGEIPWDGRLQPLRSGVAWLALRTRAPVLTMVMAGGYDIWPRWASRPHLTGKLVLKVGQPLYLCDEPCARVTNNMLQDANQRLLLELERLSGGYMLRKGAKES